MTQPLPPTTPPRTLRDRLRAGRRRVLPAPLLSAALAVLWILLSQSAHPGTLIMAVMLATAIPLLTAGLRPTHPRVKHPRVALRLARHAAADLVKSSLHTFWLLASRSSTEFTSDFVEVPLELRDPHALAVLATILALTPGTAWAEISLDRSRLLVHVLDAADPAGFVALVKTRYERPLMEIFE